MSMRDIAIMCGLSVHCCAPLAPASTCSGADTRYGFGAPASPQDLANFFSIPADGTRPATRQRHGSRRRKNLRR